LTTKTQLQLRDRVLDIMKNDQSVKTSEMLELDKPPTLKTTKMLNIQLLNLNLIKKRSDFTNF